MEKVDCTECRFSDYFGDYSIWWCERYHITINNKYDYCEGFCPRQISLEETMNGKEI